jgi:uncharacterized protein RhaS with RHS repeats
VYVTHFTHDTWGRLRFLTYPDGEKLTHRYDSGGLLREITGAKGGYSYSYVRRLEYDKFSPGVRPLRKWRRTGWLRPEPLPGSRAIRRRQPRRLFQDLRLTCDAGGGVAAQLRRRLAALMEATDALLPTAPSSPAPRTLFERPGKAGSSADVNYDNIHNISP